MRDGVFFSVPLKIKLLFPSNLLMATKMMQPQDAAISDVLTQNVEVAQQIKTAVTGGRGSCRAVNGGNTGRRRR